MNACARTPSLDAYLDGDLAPEEARAFEAHAAHCPACTDELTLARQVLTALRALPAAPCPDDLFEAALVRIAREAEDRPARPASRARTPRWRAVGLGAALLVLAAAALLVLRPAAEMNPEGPTTASVQPSPALPEPVVLPPSTVPPPDVAATEDAHAPIASDARPVLRRRAPRPAPPVNDLPPNEDIVETPTATPSDLHSPEAEAARDGALLAFALVADANRHAGEAVRENVGAQLGHVSDALSLAFPE